VVNEVLDNALAELVEIVAACREGREMQGNSAEVLLEELLRSD
jgi:hypothetical protein